MSLVRPQTSSWLLAATCLLIPLAHLTAGVGLVAWFAPVPLLLWSARRGGGWSTDAVVAGALVLAWTLACLKIITAPLPPALALAYGLPIGLLQAFAYVLWRRVRPRLGPWSSPAAFGAAMVVVEWIQHALTPFASWGSASNSQLGDLAFLQMLAWVGPAGPAFVLGFVAAALAESIEGRTGRRVLVPAAAVVLLLHGMGSLRLHRLDRAEPELVAVAAVDTESAAGADGVPDEARRKADDVVLFERTRRAAEMGAELVVWPEAGAVVMPEEEQGWLERVRALARDASVELVAAYVVPVSLEPLRYENKLQWIRPDGSIDQEYLKNRPVPGEPAVPGVPQERTTPTGFGPAAAAICYDFDFPRQGLRRAALGAGLVALPSSDWRGIDPIHTQMAALRAIEGGYSILRSTRWGLSAGIDRSGRMRGYSSAFDGGEPILLVRLPTEPAPTLYARTAGLWVSLAGLGLAALAGLSWRRRQR